MSATSMPRAATSVATSVSQIAALEAGERLLALALGLVAVHGKGLDALLTELLDEPVGAALGPDEDERATAVALLQLGEQRVELGALGVDRGEAVLDRRDVLGLRRMDVLLRVVGVLTGDLAGLAVEGGREEQRLALARQQVDDPVDGRAEAHVEHPVGLVEDQCADLRKVECTALDQILETAGGGDDHVRLAGTLDLRLDADAAVDGGDLRSLGVTERLELVDDLAARARGSERGSVPPAWGRWSRSARSSARRKRASCPIRSATVRARPCPRGHPRLRASGQERVR